MTLTWTRDSADRICSSAGHVITGVRNAAGKVLYNGWSGEPHQSKHLEQGYEADGLARCKAAAERSFKLELTSGTHSAAPLDAPETRSQGRRHYPQGEDEVAQNGSTVSA